MSKCKYCETELTKMDSGCTRCLKCNPVPEAKPEQKKDEPKYVDQPWTDERIWNSVKDKVRDMIEEWFAPQGIKETVEELVEEVKEIDDWRKKAKELGVDMFQRKKEDVLNEIREKLKVPAGDDNARP